jgi:alkylhydroperoxidase family enzyme
MLPDRNLLQLYERHQPMNLKNALRCGPAFALALAFPGFAHGDDATASDVPQKVAATRPEMKQILEGSKQSKPRLPLPPLTPEDQAKAKARAAERAKTQPTDSAKTKGRSGGLGGIVNNGRMRSYYLSPDLSGGFNRAAATQRAATATNADAAGNAGPGREADPAMSLSGTFKTEFFWIVSRANNCYYCQGHQESKLAADGLSENTIAALDGNWSEFTPAERAAFAFTLKLTKTPQAIADADIAALRAFYKDTKILEIIQTVAGNNAMNRWTGSLAIPQESHRVYLTPTSPKYQSVRSFVAPLDPVAKDGTICAPPTDRGPIPTRSEIEAALEACRNRSPRLPLIDDSAARALLPDVPADKPVPQWVRLVLTFPKAGPGRVTSHKNAISKGRLTVKLKAEIDYVAALHDRAWYALGHAQNRLRELGMTDDMIAAVATPSETMPASERAALALAKKLTIDPARITDADIAALRGSFNDFETAEVVFQITEAASFDRLTEAAGLQLER